MRIKGKKAKKTELPRKFYLWGTIILVVIIIATYKVPILIETYSASDEQPEETILSSDWITKIKLACSSLRSELVRNIALGVLGSLLCSLLLDKAGVRAKLRTAKHKWLQTTHSISSERDKIVDLIEEYGNRLNQGNIDGDEKISKLYVLPTSDGDQGIAQAYRRWVQECLTEIYKLCQNNEDLIMETAELLFGENIEALNESEKATVKATVYEELKIDGKQAQKQEDLKKEIAKFKVDYKKAEQTNRGNLSDAMKKFLKLSENQKNNQTVEANDG